MEVAMPHPTATTTARPILHLVFGDVSWDLESEFTTPLFNKEQTIRVVKEIRSEKVYCGKFYKSYTAGKRATREVIIKMAGPTSKPRDFERLEWEHSLYVTYSRLQGTVFPECLGIFKAHESCGRTTMSCLVLEKCIPSINYDKDEFNRELMLAVCKLHEVGIIHNDLLSKSHVLRHGTSPRIVDLSLAMVHSCRGGHPADHRGKISNEFRSCWELVKLEKRLWNDYTFEDEKPSSYISHIVETGSIYLSKGLETIMRNK